MRQFTVKTMKKNDVVRSKISLCVQKQKIKFINI